MKQLLSEEQLQDGVQRLATEIEMHYAGRSLTIVGILTGSIVLISDLMRKLNLPVKIGFVQASSYRGETTSPGELITWLQPLGDVEGQDVLLIDDIFDTGSTLSCLVQQLHELKPASLKTAVLLRKHGHRCVGLEPDYVAFEVPNTFVVGYGLDYNNEYRHLPYLAALEEVSDKVLQSQAGPGETKTAK